MKILLINPERLIYPPFGLLYIGSIIKARGHDIRLTEMPYGLERVERFKIVDMEIEKFRPKIIGITCMTPQVSVVKDLVKDIKKRFNDTPVIIGGVHPTVDSNDTLSWGTDIAVRGEGERTILDIIDYFDNKIEVKAIKGISYRDKLNIINNADRELIKDLNELPPLAYSLLRSERFKKRSYAIRGSWLRCGWVMTARGCPGRCIFCATKTMQGRVVREFDMERVLDEVEYLKETHDIEGLWVIDDAFTLKEKRVKEFCAGLKNRKLKIRWACQGRVDTFTDGMAEAMKKSGCLQVDFGVESGSQRILDGLKKEIRTSDTKRAFKICKSHKLRPVATIIIGSPGETLEDIKLTKKLLDEIRPSFVGCFFITPFPGTELYDTAVKNKWIDTKKDINWQTTEYPVMKIDLTQEELMQEYEDIQKYNNISAYKYITNPAFIYDMAVLFFSDMRSFFKILYFFIIGKRQEALNAFLFAFRKYLLD